MDQLARTPNDIGENGSPGTRMETIFDLCAALDIEIRITARSKGTTDFLDDTI